MRITSADGPNPRRLFKHLKIQTHNNDCNTALSDQKSLDSTSCDSHTKICLSGDSIGKICEIAMQERFEDLFEKGKKLGEGAHSCVYEYAQKKTRKSFAVKIFKDCDCERIKDIKQSFLIMSKLQHPSIAKADSLYIDKAASRCYLVTQICNYKDLRCFIENEVLNGKTISEERAGNIIYNLLVCLSYLKNKGVCHRDIKPQNILYDPADGSLKLIDFELSKMKKCKQEQFQMWTCTGSIFYRAPESFALGYSETIDMWALGVVAFQLLTGALPFFSSSLKCVTEDILNKDIDFDIYDISQEAKRFLKQTLQKDPRLRLKPQEALGSSFILKNSSEILNSPKLQLKTNSETYGKKMPILEGKCKTEQQPEGDKSTIKGFWPRLRIHSIKIIK